MKHLCGRPGCGEESTATLQIDTPGQSVSLVDPKVSRDGIPLCSRHADLTTPPQGWAMNDLRSRDRALAAVPDGETTPATPPRNRREQQHDRDEVRDDQVVARSSHDFATPAPNTEAAAATASARADRRRSTKPAVPVSRPSRRRDAEEEVEVEQDRFPWHHQYKDDEPEEMQASTPLLSRAFRSSTG